MSTASTTALVANPPAQDGKHTKWLQCPRCGALVYAKRLARNLGVCLECSYHFRINSAERLTQLLDEGSLHDLSGQVESVDVLGFTDLKPYSSRLADAWDRTGQKAAARYGTATINGSPLVVAAMEFAFMGGSMDGAVGELITRAAELATEERLPLLIVAASGGARMQEGCLSLMQMAKTNQAIARLHEEGLLSLCLLTDPTYGGVTASFASLGDILIAESGAMVGFAGPGVIEQTIREKLPHGFQTAEFLIERGMLDMVADRATLRSILTALLRLHQPPTPRRLAAGHGKPPITTNTTAPASWETVKLARNVDRPTTLDYTEYLFDEFLELHGDRTYADDPAIVGGLARLEDTTVMVIGHQKGHATRELLARNFGMPHPEGYRKALRLMRHAAKFGFPVVTLIDTPGAYPGKEAEERGQALAISQCLTEMSRLPVPVVAAVTGEGGSGGALGLGAADRVMMLENAYYSVISPEGCAMILWKSTDAAPKAAQALRVTAPDLLQLEVIESIVPEPKGGAHVDPAATASNLKEALIAALNELLPLDPDTLVEARYRRYRRFSSPTPYFGPSTPHIPAR